jgi:hypothetical protein
MGCLRRSTPTRTVTREVAAVITAAALSRYWAVQTEPLAIARRSRGERHSRQSEDEHGQDDPCACESF